ncbi:hypothetical protein LQD23_21400 [Chromobacterium violaceum]|uniref:hypothetical protein n=1 Tax=Chromobacterium violaceum TaxID=536 RepID=UPI001E51982B|nr:hypothetical protein [Chromobacterium violaceum]MCD0494835.1 hypothetical protein [Chromobacterium violaceum]
MIDVVRAVRSAFERVSGCGVKAANSIGEVRGGASKRELELSIMDAREVVGAVLMLEQRFNVALMARVNDGSMAALAGAFDDLVSFVIHYGQIDGLDVLKYGRAGVQYFVRYWLAGMGSFREFAREMGIDHHTAATFYRGNIEVLLQGWLIAARGQIEPVLLAQMDAADLVAA